MSNNKKNIVKLSLTLNLEVEVVDLSVTAHAMMERLDNVVADALTGAGDDIVTIKRVESE